MKTMKFKGCMHLAFQQNNPKYANNYLRISKEHPDIVAWFSPKNDNEFQLCALHSTVKKIGSGGDCDPTACMSRENRYCLHYDEVEHKIQMKMTDKKIPQ